MLSRVADLDGPVYFTDFEGDGPLVLLVHGLGSDHVSWTPAALMLSDRARVMALDLPGFGRSAPAGRPVDIAAQAELLSRFVAHVDRGPAVLVGSSMGGLVALLAAIASPGRVAGVVAVAPIMPIPARHTVSPQAAAMFLVPSIPVAGRHVMAVGWRIGSAGDQIGRILDYISGDTERIPEPLRSAMMESFSEWAANDWAASSYAAAVRSEYRFLTQRRPFDRMVREVRVPTLLLHGSDDPLIPVASAERVAAIRPDWSFEVLARLGHLPHAEAPDRFSLAVSRWISAVVGGGLPGSGGGRPRRGR